MIYVYTSLEVVRFWSSISNVAMMVLKDPGKVLGQQYIILGQRYLDQEEYLNLSQSTRRLVL